MQVVSVSVSDLNAVAALFQGAPELTVQPVLAPPARIVREADMSLNNGRKEVAFIDTALDDYGVLIDGVRAGIEVVLLDRSYDGLAQMAGWAHTRSAYDALHVLSHGDSGRLVLGTACVDHAALTERRSELTAIGDVLNPDGDVLLYGCGVAGGSSGPAFITGLARTMRADIAASANPTGPHSLGGDWALEARIGNVADSLFGPDWAGYGHLLAAQIVMNVPSTIYVRPGGTSYTWTFGNGASPPNLTTYAPITDIDFNDVDFPGSTPDWILTRGKFQYSTNGGSSWTDYAYPGNNINFVSVSGQIWRFVDNLAGDTTTTNNVGTSWRVAAYPGQNVSSGSVIAPDNAPTDLSANKTYFLSGSAQGTAVATLTPTDTGQTTYGYWAIDSQSVPNLFTISYNATTGNTAALNIGSGTIPAIGQTATVTARYYDLYQTDTSGNPINGQGIAKTFTFTVMNNESTDLDFGNDLNVSTTAANDQINPSVTTLSNGNFVAVWQSAGQGGESTSYNGIYGQIYSNTGTAVGSEFAITTSGNSVDETTPVVTALNSGRFAVAYATATASNGLDIAYRIVEANGTLGTQQTANTTVTGDQSTPAIATLTDGTFVIAWATGGAIHAQKINADGTKSGSELTIHAGTTDANPAIAALSNGAYAVAWGDGDYNIKAVVSTATSTVIDVTTDGVSSSIDSWMPLPRVAGLTGGGFVVAWDSYANDATNWTQSDIFFRQYSNAGVAQGVAVQANSTSATNSYRFEATVDALSGGGFVIAWQSDTGDYDQNGIFGRRFTSAGVAVDASDFEINKYRVGDQNSPAVTALASDAFATVWVDNTSDTTSAGIEGRVLNVTNLAPTLSTVSTITGVTEDTQKAIALSDLLGLANENDSDGTVTAFVVKAVSAGTLKIGTSAGTATAWAAGTNDTIDATHSAYWTPAADANGSALNAFTIVAKDNGGAESASAVQVKADVSAVNDAPVIHNLSGDGSNFTPGTPEYVDAQPTIADAATITDDNANFNNGYLRITQTAGTADGSFSFDTSVVKSGADTASADSTIAAGETVYVDDGGSWVAVGTIDNAEDGQSGHGLKINFNANALNGNPNAGQMNAPAGIIGYLQYTSGTIGSRSFNMVLNDGALSSSAAAFSMTGLGITGVTSSTADGTYKVGSTVNVKVTFNDTVTVAGGTPSLLLETGATDRAATYVSGSGTSTLTFEYTVQTGDNAADLDYASVTALALNGAAIQDAAGHDADLTLPAPGATGSLANGKAIVIEGQAPTDIALSNATVTTSGGVNAVIGTLSSTDATSGDSFTYTLVSGSGDTDNASFNISGSSLRATAAASLTAGVKSVRVRTTDAAGNTYDEALNITVTSNPTVTITSDKSTLKAGEMATITFTFSDVPLGFADGDVSVSGGSLGSLTVDGGNSKVYTATFTPAANTQSLGASISVAANKFKDASDQDNLASNTLSITGDTKLPTATIMLADTALKVGETSLVTITFSEAVSGLTNADLTVSNGTLGAVSSSDGGTTWTATFTPSASMEDTTNAIQLDNSGVADLAGNTGSGTTDSDNYAIDTKAPTVSDAQVSITGSSGTGGTFKTGDTVTVAWDNTATGDNNGDIAAVTVDFSQFGGGSAVAADNNSGIWSASYTIVAGSIDNGNRNVAVTATDNAGNSATRTDTTNASVDNQAPTVSDARISIAGASGTGGTYKIGDVVTATWNNTAGGDNNSDIAAVSFNFSQFGGGSAVAATNNSGTWSATYTIAAGSIDASNLNVSAKATDDAGNSTTRADSTNAAVDNIRPSVSSIAVSGTPASNATEVDFAVTLNEAVTGLDTGDFTLTATGAAAGSIASITGSGSSYTVKVNGISGNGTLRLDLKGTGTGISDDAGNTVAGGFTAGGVHNSNFNAVPVINSNGGGATAAVSIAEYTTAVTTVGATDADSDTLTYSISGGADSALFTIDGATGVLAFGSAHNVAAPADANHDSAYQVEVIAADGKGGTDMQALTVTVLSDIDRDGAPDTNDDDIDDDGNLNSIETPVPNANGGGTGDGNGDGTADSEQINVASLPTLASVGGTPRYATLAVADGLTLSSVSNSAVSGTLPRNVKMPLGQFDYTIGNVTAGGTVTVDMYVDAALGMNGYYKLDAANKWQNLASAVTMVGSKTRITFSLTDGGIYDSDHTANGTIVDPGGAVQITPLITSNGGNATATANVSEMTRAVSTVTATSVGTVTYSITGGADAALFAINAATGALSFIDAPDFETPADTGDNAGNNTYVVDVTATDASGSDTQTLTVRVLDVDENPPTTPPTTVGTVDGVVVQTSTVTNGDGSPPTTIIEIAPVNNATRVEDNTTSNATMADIPVMFSGGQDRETATSVSLPNGIGLRAQGSTQPISNVDALKQLIPLITSTSDDRAESDKSKLIEGGQAFLNQLAKKGGDAVLVHEITLKTASTDAPEQPITISGNTTTGGPVETLVIDVSQMPKGTVINLKNVEFAVIIGMATLTGGEGSNVVFAGSGEQTIVLGPDDDELHGGGGNDIVGSAGGNDRLFGDDGDDFLFGGIGNDMVNGGSGVDMLQGGRSDMGQWDFYLNSQGQVVGRHNTKLVNSAAVESVAVDELNTTVAALSFVTADQAKLKSLSLLYHAAFNRAPDLGGLNYWAAGTRTLEQFAQGFTESPEWKSGLGKLSDRALVEQLYQNILGHAGNSNDIAQWVDKLGSHAVTRLDVLKELALNSEHQALWITSFGVALGGTDLAQEQGWIAGSGDDTLNGGEGTDTLVGGDGIDTVVYDGKLSDYKFLLFANGDVKIAQAGGQGDTDVIRQIEKGQFGDTTIDLGFTQESQQKLQQVGMLYQTVLGRSGDLSGFAFWVNKQMNAADMAASFTQSVEFRQHYGELGDDAFITLLYQNASHHAPDAAGLQNWKNYLGSHTRGELISAFITDPEVIGVQYGTEGLWMV